MPRERPCIRCPKCRGVGTVPMPKEMLDTIGALRRGPRSTVEMLYIMGDTASANSALVNRLRGLEALGLVSAVSKAGRSIVWKLTERGRAAEAGE